MTEITSSIALTFSRDQVDLIKNTVAKGASDEELQLFLYHAQRAGLDPLAKQIYFQKRNNNRGGSDVVFITSIDGYRLTADRTGRYAGNDDPLFDNEDSPKKATVTVYKMLDGQRVPFTATARWSEYYPGDAKGFMWKRMPCTMLGKCAEALALRKAFPRELSGLYTKEEMDQAQREEMPEAPSAPQAYTSPRPLHRSPKAADQELYNKNDITAAAKLEEYLASKNVDKSLWVEISDKLHGNKKSEVMKLIEKVDPASLVT